MSVARGIDCLKDAIKDDADYAWSWHCNIACPMIDSGLTPEQANKAAANVMLHIFGVDTRNSAYYRD